VAGFVLLEEDAAVHTVSASLTSLGEVAAVHILSLENIVSVCVCELTSLFGHIRCTPSQFSRQSSTPESGERRILLYRTHRP